MIVDLVYSFAYLGVQSILSGGGRTILLLYMIMRRAIPICFLFLKMYRISHGIYQRTLTTNPNPGSSEDPVVRHLTDPLIG